MNNLSILWFPIRFTFHFIFHIYGSSKFCFFFSYCYINAEPFSFAVTVQNHLGIWIFLKLGFPFHCRMNILNLNNFIIKIFRPSFSFIYLAEEFFLIVVLLPNDFIFYPTLNAYMWSTHSGACKIVLLFHVHKIPFGYL